MREPGGGRWGIYGGWERGLKASRAYLSEVLIPAMKISVLHIGNQKSTRDTNLYWFRYMVPYVQFGVDLLFSYASYKGLLSIVESTDWDLPTPPYIHRGIGLHK